VLAILSDLLDDQSEVKGLRPVDRDIVNFKVGGQSVMIIVDG